MSSSSQDPTVKPALTSSTQDPTVTPALTSSTQKPSVKPGATKALQELEIPGRKSEKLPEPPAQAGETLWGVNHGAVVDNFPNNGLQLHIPAWNAMNAGDSVSVLLDDVKVTTKTITANEVNQRVTDFVEARHLEGGRYILKHRVSRFGQADETSGETHIWVKLDRPGGKDPDGNTPGHPELKFTLPEAIVNDGVDADAAKAGVLVTIAPYPGIAVGDVIKLSWGGVFVQHTVTAKEVDDAFGENKAIEILVEEKYILEGGDSDADGLAVTFEVSDIVDNRSEDWAAETRIVVDTGNSRLDSPIIKEAIGTVLDLDTLESGPVTVQITVRAIRERMDNLIRLFAPEWAAPLQTLIGKRGLSRLGALKADFVVGDRIVAKVTGTTADGQPVSYEAPEVTVEYLGKIFEIEIPNSVVRQLAQTQAVFSYRALHENDTESKSRGAFISVIGEAVRMAAPVALDAEQGAIDPDLEDTTVQVPWDDSMALGDVLTLKWIGTRPNLTIYDPELANHIISKRDVDSKVAINFKVPGVHLEEIDGGTLELYFILSQVVGNETSKRESARAARLNVGDPVAELPEPLVAGVINDAIDPEYGETTLTVPAYPDMAEGDEVSYWWDGSIAGRVEDMIRLNSATVDKDVKFQLYAEDISSNDGGTVEASYWVDRANGHRSDSAVLTFSVGHPVVLDPPVISDIRDSKNQSISDGGSTSDTSVTLSGTAAATKEVEVFDENVSKGKPVANDSGQWTLTINELAVAEHVITAKALYGENEESAARRFTVSEPAELDPPVISSVKDSNGKEIPDNGSTTDTNVTLSGTAAPSLGVEVFDGVASKGKPIADANGDWTLSVTALEVAEHEMTAKALYGEEQVSTPRMFTVTTPYPIITSIKDSSGAEVPEDGETIDLRLTFIGLATPNAQVRLLDAEGSATQSGEVIATVLANSNGEWTATAEVRFYEWHVVWILADGIPSAPRTFYTHIDPGPPPEL